MRQGYCKEERSCLLERKWRLSPGTGPKSLGLVCSREMVGGLPTTEKKTQGLGDTLRSLSTLLFLLSEKLRNTFTEINEALIVIECYHFCSTDGVTSKVIK